MQVKPFIPCLTGSPLIKSAKRDTVLTTLLLLDTHDLKLLTQCLASIEEGPAHIDEDLVLSLYSAGDDKARLMIACSAVTSRMSPRAFRKVFDPVYARTDLSVQQRRELMWSLEPFLRLNPRHGRDYERIILELARSRQHVLSVRGVPMAALYARLDASMLSLFTRHLKSRSPDMRLTAINSFGHMVDRLNELPRELRDFLASDAFRMQVSRIYQSDPDEFLRMGTWHLLRRLRNALGTRRRRASPSRR